ncbi:MAG: polysaccharide pyruvyl transferase family protein [Clostridia bacterium]|nr:polysaccharide pyruvyl transferase family protein [Clostridia bacterium]
MDKKKVAILTCGLEPNYGACLQAFATQQAINSLGCESEILNYSFMSDKEYSPFVQKSIKAFISSILYYNLRKSLNKAFKQFRSEHMKYAADKFNSQETARDSIDGYDMVLVGSDQVWNPHLGIDVNITLLNFYKDGPIKASYASSFGISELPPEKESIYLKALSEFKHISVRENTGAAIIKKLIDKDIPVVADPTMLLKSDDWDKYALEVETDGKYLLIYDMAHSDLVLKTAKKIAAELGVKIIALSRIILPDKSIKTLRGISPANFLYLIKNAEAIVTDSFHGTLFSAIYHKNFYSCCPLPGRKISSRITGFLKNVGLEERIVYDVDNVVSGTVNYESADLLIDRIREDSYNYLQDVLGEI